MLREIDAYVRARAAFEKELDAYWEDIATKRRARMAKRRAKQATVIEDYVLTQPPVYSGPARPAGLAPPRREPVDVKLPPIPRAADFIAAAKEHYKFGSDNPPPPIKGLGEPGWRPQCDWSRYGLAFSDYNDVPASADPRERLKWVEFHQPVYDGNGATIETGIMHGPLAGMGYECRLRSGIAGWTVTECKTSWVS